MDAKFWHQRWETNEIAFHESQPNPLLVRYFKELSVEKGSRVFLPLCGKTLAIGWLLSNGYQVAGAELSEMAIQQLFEELGIKPEVTEIGAIKRYSAANIDMFVGDIFHLTREMLGTIDAVYDRAALFALPETVRIRYAKHLIEITNHAPQLLITFEYDQTLMQGPPFSVSKDEVSRHYQDNYTISLLASMDFAGGIRGRVPAKEMVWLLKH